MKLTDPTEIKVQLSNALDFALAHLVPFFNKDQPPQINTREFATAGLASVHATAAIPRVSVTFNNVLFAENQRVYSFVNQDFFEMSTMDQCGGMVSMMADFTQLSLRTMDELRIGVYGEVMKKLGSVDISEEEIKTVKKKIADDIGLTFQASEFSKTLFCSFVRLMMVRQLGEYTDSYYQDQILEIDVQFDNDTNVLIVTQTN
jgi:hypothetical protein